MHNTLTRLQNTFGYLTSCAFFLAFLISALSLVPITPPSSTASSSAALTATLSVRNIQVVRGRPHYYSSKREEYAHIRFDLDADLTRLFSWNTKQVFVYVSAEYPAPDASTGPGPHGGEDHLPGMNKAVIWDTIITPPATRWSFANVKERYFPGKKGKKAAATDKSKKSSASRSSRDKAGEKTTSELTKPGLLALRNQKPKYQITDPSGVISSRANATLTLSWNVQPWVGPLLWDRGMLEDKNGASGGGGVGAEEGSWNLPFLKHQWQGGVLPRSERFDFPPLKAAQKTTVAETVQGKEGEGPKTPEAAEVSGVV